MAALVEVDSVRSRTVARLWVGGLVFVVLPPEFTAQVRVAGR